MNELGKHKAHTLIKYTAMASQDMPPSHRCKEPVTTQQAQWEMGEGTEVKTKQTVKVTTAASHSKHESSELR